MNKFWKVSLTRKNRHTNTTGWICWSQREADYLERLLFGTSKVIVENLGLGEVYGNLVKVISISILYFNLGTGDDYVYYGTTEFRGLHTGHPLLLRERVEAICDTFTYQQKNVFPDYYLINVERFQDVIESSLDEWIYMLKHNSVREDFKAPKIEKAREKLALLKMSPAERKQYERYVESVVIERDMFETARADGLEEGIAMGIEKGKIEGRVEGHREMLKTLHQHGMSIEQISSVTGLNAVEVQQLLEN